MKISLRSSMYAKITFVFIALLLLTGGIHFFLLAKATDGLLEQSRYHADALRTQNVADALQPMLIDSLDLAALEHTGYYINLLCPSADLFLLDSRGNVIMPLTDVATHLDRVDIAPVQAYFEKSATDGDVLGEDPIQAGKHVHFAAAKLYLGKSEKGYLYVVNRTQAVKGFWGRLWTNPVTRASALASLFSMIMVGLLGLVAFAYLVRKISRVRQRVQRFEGGDYSQRFDVRANDEIAQLARSFNQLADRIEGQQDEIQHKDRLRRELISNISHDLRNPLASIMGYLETILLKEDSLSPERRREYIERIYKNTSNLTLLVSDLFELSRLDAQEKTPKTETFALGELAQDVMLRFKPQAEEKGVQLIGLLPDNSPMVTCDIGMIERALSNILENALDYTSAGGEVCVKVSREQQHVCLVVSDTGCGIPVKDLPHVFERFYRVDKSRTPTAIDGFGLGLAIARGIIEAHDGEIEASSELDKGTTITITLPVAAKFVAA